MLRFRKFKEKGDVLMNIHDIAKLAGVSVSTVSKVMNGKDKDISEKTKQRVLKVIEEEQYIPYLKFREKEGLKSYLIGLVLKKDNREGERIIHSAQKAAADTGFWYSLRKVWRRCRNVSTTCRKRKWPALSWTRKSLSIPGNLRTRRFICARRKSLTSGRRLLFTIDSLKRDAWRRNG